MRPWLNTKVVILVGSKSALKAIVNNDTQKSSQAQSIQK